MSFSCFSPAFCLFFIYYAKVQKLFQTAKSDSPFLQFFAYRHSRERQALQRYSCYSSKDGGEKLKNMSIYIYIYKYI